MSAIRTVQLAMIVGLALGCAASNTEYSGETHFLSVCDSACGSGLRCICGVCTRACDSDRECRGLNAEATCDGPGTPAGSCEAAAAAGTCSVTCARDADCAALGSGALCLQGECRVDAGESCALGGSLYPDGSLDIPAGDGCNSCSCSAGRLTCTRLDCSAPLTPVDGPVSVVAADDELPGAADAGPASESLPQTLPLSLSGTLRIADGFELDGRVLRMALVWYPAYLDGPIEPFTPSAMCANPEGLDLSYRGLVAQELPLAQELQDELLLAPQFPLPFSVQITELPPAEALRPLPDGQPGSWSTGKLIVYEDCDENGRLDSSSLAETAQDTVLGTSSDWFASVGQFEDVSAWYDIYYAEARISSPRVEAGFSIQRILNDPMAGYPSAMLPIETEVEIALSASARIATLNCEELCHVGDEAFECPTDVASLPTGGVFQCYGRGDLLWSRENCDGCTCTSVSCAMASPSAGPLPSDWPCD